MATKTKVIKEFPDYEITSNGEVFSNRTGTRKQLRPSTSTGYAKVSLVNKKGTSNLQIHRLVGLHFLDVPKNHKSMIVNHKDGNKLNNKLSNLEWTTRKGNSEHYSKELYPKQKEARQAKKQELKILLEEDREVREKIIAFADEMCSLTGNTALFHAIYKTTSTSARLEV